MPRIGFGAVALAYLTLVLLLGGASAAGFIGNFLIQVLGAGLIGFCLSRPSWSPEAADFPWRRLLAAWLALIVVQLVPLPPAIWSSLPGRQAVAQGFALLDQPLPWLPLSLDPWGTIASLAWWLPAFALLLAMARSDAPRGQHVAQLLAVVAALSIAISAMQRASGAFYFYRITNYGMGTGFFANSNHQASFLLITLALWGASQASAPPPGVRADRRQAGQALYWGVVLLLVIGVLLSNSLAGVGLLLPVLGGLALIAVKQRAFDRRLVIGVIAATVVLAIAYGVFFWRDVSLAPAGGGHNRSRLDYLVTSWPAIRDSLPFGWGLGSFSEIYQWYEPAASLNSSYANHAHDDLWELILETGVFGLIPLALFLAWWAPWSVRLWKNRTINPFACGASLATAAVLAHSLVDYPLRTAAVSSLFAVCCMFMLRRSSDRESSSSSREQRPVSPRVQI